MRRPHIIVLLLIVVLSFWLRGWNAFETKSYLSDEIILVPGMENYFAFGTFFPDGWEQPPFNYYLLRLSTYLFGVGPLAWRIKNILLGGIAPLVIYLLALELLKSRKMALLAALMMAIEPMHILFSRSANAEVPATTFFLLASICVIRFAKGSLQTLLPAGILLGLTHAQKWYFLLPSLMLLLYVVLAYRRDPGVSRPLIAGYSVTMLLLVPFTLYTLPYYQWLGRGYDLREFVLLQFDAYRELQAQDLKTFIDPFIRSSMSSPIEWFIKPMIHVTKYMSNGMAGQYLAYIGNIPVWMLTFPSFALLSYASYKKKNIEHAIVVILFCFSYFQFAAVRRPVFLYSALTVLPFVYLAVSHFIVTLAEQTRKPTVVVIIIALLLVTAGLYYYPLVTNGVVPALFYDYLITFQNS